MRLVEIYTRMCSLISVIENELYFTIYPIYEICPKSKCTDFPMYDLGLHHLVNVYRRVRNDLVCV
jgi:hypothetical protein